MWLLIVLLILLAALAVGTGQRWAREPVVLALFVVALVLLVLLIPETRVG